MKYNISKELFEAVMNNKFDYIKIDGIFIIGHENLGIVSISIDTFFFKCKEWALKQGYDINSGYSHHLIDYTPKGYYCWIKNKKSSAVEMYRKLSEQQSVFDCCQWVLENKEKQ